MTDTVAKTLPTMIENSSWFLFGDGGNNTLEMRDWKSWVQYFQHLCQFSPSWLQQCKMASVQVTKQHIYRECKYPSTEHEGTERTEGYISCPLCSSVARLPELPCLSLWPFAESQNREGRETYQHTIFQMSVIWHLIVVMLILLPLAKSCPSHSAAETLGCINCHWKHHQLYVRHKGNKNRWHSVLQGQINLPQKRHVCHQSH